MSKKNQDLGKQPVDVIDWGFVYSFEEQGRMCEGHRTRTAGQDRFVVYPAHDWQGYSMPLDVAELLPKLQKIRPL